MPMITGGRRNRAGDLQSKIQNLETEKKQAEAQIAELAEKVQKAEAEYPAV